HEDEPVSSERLHGVQIEVGDGPFRVRHEPERRSPPLPERALERPLLAQRLVALATGRTALSERADVAARNASEADIRAEIHQRLRPGRGECVSRALLHATYVDVDREDVMTEREAGDGVGGI